MLIVDLTFGVTATLQGLDDVDLEAEFCTGVCVMKSPPAFLRGHCKSATRFALSESDRARDRNDPVGATRAWKLFLLIPRLLLHRPARGGNIPKCRLKDRFTAFAAGHRGGLLHQSRERESAEQCAVSVRRRRRRAGGDDIQRRADRAEALVQLGELSSGRHAPEGVSLAPGTNATLDELQDPNKRPPVPREELPNDFFVRRGPLFDLDHDIFAKNLRVSRRGAAGPSGMTAQTICDPCWTAKSTLPVSGDSPKILPGQQCPMRLWTW